MEIVQHLNPNDVLCGRGSGPNDYSGNINFRALVLERRDEYLSTSNRASKAKIAREIVGYVHNLSPPGRFLEQVEGNNSKVTMWRVVSEEKALEKAKQALRQNRHRRSGGSMGSGSVGFSACSSADSPPIRMGGHNRSSSFNSYGHSKTHVRSMSHTPYSNYGPHHDVRPLMVGSSDLPNHHRRHRSDQFFDSHPGPHQPLRRHHRSYSDRGHHYVDLDYNYNSAPAFHHSNHPNGYSYQNSIDYRRPDRKYFNRHPPVPTHQESLDEDLDNDLIESHSIPHTNGRFNDDAITFPEADIFSRDNNFNSNRTRNLSADSDISAISLGNDQNNQDPMSISDFPDVQPIRSSKLSTDRPSDSINEFHNFDMSYYMLQTLADETNDL